MKTLRLFAVILSLLFATQTFAQDQEPVEAPEAVVTTETVQPGTPSAGHVVAKYLFGTVVSIGAVIGAALSSSPSDAIGLIGLAIAADRLRDSE